MAKRQPAIRYCLDTSFLINGWHRRYRIDVFPTLWSAVDSLIEQGTICSCEEVLSELTRGDDALVTWAKERKACFQRPTSDTLANLRTVMQSKPNIAATGGSLNRADPFVVAHAMTVHAIVVTDEQPAPNLRSTKPPKMPDVCDALGVKWLPPIEFLAAIKLVL